VTKKRRQPLSFGKNSSKFQKYFRLLRIFPRKRFFIDAAAPLSDCLWQRWAKMGFARYSGLVISGCAGPNLAGQPSRAALFACQNRSPLVVKTDTQSWIYDVAS